MDALYEADSNDNVLAGLFDSINADREGADPLALLNGIEDELLRFMVAWRTLNHALRVIVDVPVTETNLDGALDLSTLANIMCNSSVGTDGDVSKCADGYVWVRGRLGHVMCAETYIRLHAPQSLAQSAVISVRNIDGLFHAVAVNATVNAIAELLNPDAREQGDIRRCWLVV